MQGRGWRGEKKISQVSHTPFLSSKGCQSALAYPITITIITIIIRQVPAGCESPAVQPEGPVELPQVT